ncbi:OLC1v1015150C1 [Oldenlandia corymbosa var. corymbosa]|uniref:OLC1v1015150C1 n=1 Tax=Oldenlandia corymbosa var. corymbosa TaxID=529605 RepID=A0AAV1E626_OLDCO|nr:OLC1v1015150C1 [Oldenlandia corymbosa var. corymbosa]
MASSIPRRRYVQNVGSEAGSVYEVKVNAPPSVEVNVSPSKLVFSEIKQTLSYEVTFTSGSNVLERVDGGINSAFGSLEWSDGVHVVQSPIAVVWSLSSSVASM